MKAHGRVVVIAYHLLSVCLFVLLSLLLSVHGASFSQGIKSFDVNVTNSRCHHHDYDFFDFWCQVTTVDGSLRGLGPLLGSLTCIQEGLEWF